MVTIEQYCAFLNAVAQNDTYSLYSPFMATDLNIAGISRSGQAGNYVYEVIDNAGNSAQRPITYVSWFDAARFTNWMDNGQKMGSQSSFTTEDGAYRLNGALSGNAVAVNSINPNTGEPPSYYIPYEDEWYKAAFYNPTLDNGSGGYYLYAMQNSSMPGNKVGSLPNQCNVINTMAQYSVTQSSVFSANENYLSDVGAFTKSPSFYGTFDQSGLLWEWNDLTGSPGVSRGLRGSGWFGGAIGAQSTSFSWVSAAREANDAGFRLAAVRLPLLSCDACMCIQMRTQLPQLTALPKHCMPNGALALLLVIMASCCSFQLMTVRFMYPLELAHKRRCPTTVLAE